MRNSANRYLSRFIIFIIILIRRRSRTKSPKKEKSPPVIFLTQMLQMLLVRIFLHIMFLVSTSSNFIYLQRRVSPSLLAFSRCPSSSIRSLQICFSIAYSPVRTLRILIATLELPSNDLCCKLQRNSAFLSTNRRHSSKTVTTTYYGVELCRR